MVGKIILWIIVGFFALLLLLLLVPVALYVDYQKKAVTLKVRVLFIKVRVFPAKEKDPEKEKRKAERKKAKEAKRAAKTTKKQPAQQQPEEKPKRTLEQTLELVRRLVSAASPAAKFVFGRLRVRDVELVLPVHGEDAAQTALNFGRLQAVLYGIYAALQNFANITYRRLNLIPDYMNQYGDDLIFSCKIMASPVIMLIAAGIGLKQYIKYGQDKKENYRLARQQMLEQRRARAAPRRAQKASPAPPEQPGAQQQVPTPNNK